jgi:hypothetical protein
MTDANVIERLGGVSCVARLLGVTKQAVSQWQHDGVPRARRQTLALLRPDVVPAEWMPPAQDSPTAHGAANGPGPAPAGAREAAA